MSNLNPTDAQGKAAGQHPSYELTWRNKFLTDDATSFDEMIERMEAALNTLKDMRAAGITLDDSGMYDDYARFTTDDPDLAERFGFEIEHYDDDDDFDEIEDDDDFEEASSQALNGRRAISGDFFRARRRPSTDS